MNTILSETIDGVKYYSVKDILRIYKIDTFPSKINYRGMIQNDRGRWLNISDMLKLIGFRADTSTLSNIESDMTCNRFALLQSDLNQSSRTRKLEANEVVDTANKSLLELVQDFQSNSLFKLLLELCGIEDVATANEKKLYLILSSMCSMMKANNLNYIHPLAAAQSMNEYMTNHSRIGLENISKTNGGPSYSKTIQLLQELPKGETVDEIYGTTPHIFTQILIDNANNQQCSRQSRHCLTETKRLPTITLVTAVNQGESEMQTDTKYLRRNFISSLKDTTLCDMRKGDTDTMLLQLYSLIKEQLSKCFSIEEQNKLMQEIQSFQGRPRLNTVNYKECPECGKKTDRTNLKYCEDPSCHARKIKLIARSEQRLVQVDGIGIDKQRATRGPNIDSETYTSMKEKIAQSREKLTTLPPQNFNPSSKEGIKQFLQEWQRLLTKHSREWDVIVTDGSPGGMIRKMIDDNQPQVEHLHFLVGRLHEIMNMIDCIFDVLEPLCGDAFAAQHGYAAKPKKLLKNKDTHQSLDFASVFTVAVCAEIIQLFRNNQPIPNPYAIESNEFVSAMKWAFRSENRTLKTLSNLVVRGAGSLIVYKEAVSNANLVLLSVCRRVFAPFWSVFHKTTYERLIIQEEYDFRCMEKSGLSDLSTKLQQCSLLTRNGSGLYQGADAIQEEINRETERAVSKKIRSFEDFENIADTLKSRTMIRNGVLRLANIRESSLPGSHREALDTTADIRGIRRITHFWFQDTQNDEVLQTIYGEKVLSSDIVSEFYSSGVTRVSQRNRELALSGRFTSKAKKKLVIECVPTLHILDASTDSAQTSQILHATDVEYVRTDELDDDSEVNNVSSTSPDVSEQYMSLEDMSQMIGSLQYSEDRTTPKRRRTEIIESISKRQRN